MKKCGLAAALSTALLLVPAYLSNAAIADSDRQSSKKPSSPITGGVRVQPRGQDFMPNTTEDDAIQRRLSISNEQQGLEDVALDKKLRICRGC